MDKQIITTSKGCHYGCPFCFNGKNKFEEYELPEIRSNNVIIHDDAFLSRNKVLSDIKKLGSIKVNGKVVNYEIKQGINLKDLKPDIAQALKENRFKKIRFAWDDSYTKKSYYRVYDGIKILLNAGYKERDLICYILSNYYVSLHECMFKAYALLYRHIKICNCRFRKYYHDPKVYPELWTQNEIDFFTKLCRHFNQLMMYSGYDPEITYRLSRAITLPSAVLSESLIAVKRNNRVRKNPLR